MDIYETLRYITNEPTDNIRVSLSVRPQSMRIQLNCRRYTVKETEYDRFVDTQQQYQHFISMPFSLPILPTVLAGFSASLW